jgi:hypothetical protein
MYRFVRYLSTFFYTYLPINNNFQLIIITNVSFVFKFSDGYKSTMNWCSVYLTPQDLPKYIYLSLPLIFPTTYNGIRTKYRQMHEIFFLSDILFASCYFTCTCLVLEISLFGSIVVKHYSKVFHIWHSDPYMARHSTCAPVRVTNRSHSTYGSKLKFSLSEYFNFLFAYLVLTYYSLQFLSIGDTK